MGLSQMLSVDVQDTSMLEVLESSKCNNWSYHKMIKSRLSKFIRYLRDLLPSLGHYYEAVTTMFLSDAGGGSSEQRGGRSGNEQPWGKALVVLL